MGRAGATTAPCIRWTCVVEASDRPGLLRDISEVFAKEKMNVTGVHTQSVQGRRGGTAWMTFTVEVADAARLAPVLAQVAQRAGVRHARRKRPSCSHGASEPALLSTARALAGA
ncbi:MAG: ACT domain-containing protein [Comamonadaceae bacterium]|nr:ACT domain-containing protein [Comamonadaceae bacterium]